MIRAWFNRLYDFIATGEALACNLGTLPEDNE